MDADFNNTVSRKALDHEILMKKKTILPHAMFDLTPRSLWPKLPFRKLFELCLLVHARLPVHPGTHTYKRFKPGAREYLRKIIDQLPPSRDKDFMLAILPRLKAPGKISLRYVTIEESILEIFQNGELSNLIQTLSLLFVDDKIIHEYSQKIILLSSCSVTDLKKYKYWFWNTNFKDGWSVGHKYALNTLIKSIPIIQDAYRDFLRDVYNGESRAKLITRLRLPLRPSDRKNLLIQAVDSELSQINHSQQKNDRKDVRDGSLNLRSLLETLERAKVDYSIPSDNDSDSKFDIKPVYTSSIGGDG